MPEKLEVLHVRVAVLAHRLNDKEHGEDAEERRGGGERRRVAAGREPQPRAKGTEGEEQDQFPLWGVKLAGQLIPAEGFHEIDENAVVVCDIPHARRRCHQEHSEIAEESPHLDVDAGADRAQVTVPGPTHRGEVGGEAKQSGGGGRRAHKCRARTAVGIFEEEPGRHLKGKEGEEEEAGHAIAVLYSPVRGKVSADASTATCSAHHQKPICNPQKRFPSALPCRLF
mmetsp:Transcript_13225/g.32080  ORF Transcript_13225/g.32080 Transcript_13225/m.32080 type:complete len:227 (-) Transcript_13225:160-840(-)